MKLLPYKIGYVLILVLTTVIIMTAVITNMPVLGLLAFAVIVAGVVLTDLPASLDSQLTEMESREKRMFTEKDIRDAITYGDYAATRGFTSDESYRNFLIAKDKEDENLN